MVLVDTNVLIDVTTDDARWGEWSAGALARAIDGGGIGVNPVVYAEFSLAYLHEKDAARALDTLRATRLDLPWPAAFLAGKAFALYKSRGGGKAVPLPDFFIGAHAAVSALPLLTRDPKRIAEYFPKVKLISP